MSSIVVTIKSGRVYADLARFIDVAGNPRGGVQKLKQYFKSVESGAENASITVQRASDNSVAATGTLLLTYASMQNNDTCAIAGVTLTAVTTTPSTDQFKIDTSATVTAASLLLAIAANATISKLVTAAKATGTGTVLVTLTALQPGVCGNQYTLATSRDPGITVSAAKMTGGTGGAQTAAITYSRGI